MPTSTTDYENFQAGDRVKHPKFGDGTIMQRSGSGKQTRFVVTFAEEGEKYLMARYAKLKKITPISTKKEAKPEASEEFEEDKIVAEGGEEIIEDEDDVLDDDDTDLDEDDEDVILDDVDDEEEE